MMTNDDDSIDDYSYVCVEFVNESSQLHFLGVSGSPLYVMLQAGVNVVCRRISSGEGMSEENTSLS